MQKITYKIYTLGCKVNQCDSRSVGKLFEKNGFSLLEKEADLVVVNTCAVTKTAISKAKSVMNRARKENPGAKVVLMGCWPEAHTSEIKGFDVDFVWGVGDVSGLMKEVSRIMKDDSKPRKISEYYERNKEKKIRYFLKVQDGCEQFCSYCIIPYARGVLKSRRLDDVLNEVENVVNEGAGEIVLSGIHLGLYGSDLEGDINLTELVREILKIKNLGRIRLSSIEINEVTDELLDLLKNEKKLCRHLHVPMQAGSQRILKLMNRPYTKKYIDNRLMTIMEMIPDIAISTDVIVGFPGETEEEFLETCELVKKVKFSKVHVFPYSLHEKTPAAKFLDQVSSNEKKRRAKILREIAKNLEKEYFEKFKKKKHEVIIEQIKDDKLVLKSEFYFDVHTELKVVKSLFSDKKNIHLGQIFNWYGV